MIGQPMRALPIASITEPAFNPFQPEKSHYTDLLSKTPGRFSGVVFTAPRRPGHAPLQRKTTGAMRLFRYPEAAVRPVSVSLDENTNCGFGCHIPIFPCPTIADLIRNVNDRPRIDTGRPYFPPMCACLLRELHGNRYLQRRCGRLIRT